MSPEQRECRARRYYDLNRQISIEIYNRKVPTFDEAVRDLITAGMEEKAALEWFVNLHFPKFSPCPSCQDDNAGNCTCVN